MSLKEQLLLPKLRLFFYSKVHFVYILLRIAVIALETHFFMLVAFWNNKSTIELTIRSLNDSLANSNVFMKDGEDFRSSTLI